MQHSVQNHTTSDGIKWHVERFQPSNTRQAQNIILIPSGEGDCHNLINLAKILCSEYHYNITTFDNPGFSRTEAPAEAYDVITPQLMASQIQRLLSDLGIKQAHAFGCSSGGLAVLALAALYPELITSAIVHEVPLECPQSAIDMKQMEDSALSAICAQFFATVFVEDAEKWNALGPKYHARLAKNYVTWMRHVVGNCESAGRELATRENLTKRPVFWTVGALSPGVQEDGGMFGADFVVAKEAGLEVDKTTLKCFHFPAVTVPEETARWIDGCVNQVGQ